PIKPDYGQKQLAFLGYILEGAFGSTQDIEQGPHAEDAGDLGAGYIVQAGNPVFGASAINQEECTQPEKRRLRQVPDGGNLLPNGFSITSVVLSPMATMPSFSNSDPCARAVECRRTART